MGQKKIISIIFFLSLAMAAYGLILSDSGECPSEIAGHAFHPEMCTTVLVGKDASTDGSVIACQTADCGICDFTWQYMPAADHAEGAARKIYHISQIKTWPPEIGGKWINYKKNYTGVDIPQVAHTYAYQYAVFAHMNEHQLAIVESTIGCRIKMRNPTPSAVMDVTTLTMIAMERCTTARDAIRLMGSLAEKYGYGFHDSGEMLGVADPDEIWMFEIMPVGPLWTPESGKPGAVWCAQRVPDDHISFCPNESRIGEIDIKDKDRFMASKNAVSFAVEKGFYDPESGRPFSWKRAYSPSPGSAASTQARRGRLWRLFSIAAPSRDFSPETEGMDFPFSVKPDKKISLPDVMAITRDKYQGTQFDPASGIKGGPYANPNYYKGFKLDGKRYNGPRCICVPNAEYTTITQCRGWLPDPIGGINWIAFGAQDTSCYIPLYCGITDIPDSFKKGDHFVFSRDSARWAFDYVDFHTQVVYSRAIKDVQDAQDIWEAGNIRKIPVIDRAAADLYEQDPAEAVGFLTDFCISNADRNISAWWKLGDSLLVKYNHFGIYDAGSRSVKRVKSPEWWNKAVKACDKPEPLPRKEKQPERN